MFEKKQNEFARQAERPTKKCCGILDTRSKEPGCFGCLALWVFAHVLGGSVLFAGTCILPSLEFDERCEAANMWLDSTIADCHPAGHECGACNRNRENKEDR